MIHTEIIKKIQQKHKEKFGIKPSKNEIRLLNYCPTLQERPDFFKKHNIFNVPMNRKTSYWIKGTKSMNGYFDFTGNKTIQNNKPEKIELPRKDLDPIYNIGESESTAISLSFYNGLFKKKKSKYYNLSPSAKLLLWDKQIIQKATNFDFYVKTKQNKISATGGTWEPDAVYADDNTVLIIEAKKNMNKDYMIRQLYYPYRIFSEHMKISKDSREIKTLYLLYKINKKQDQIIYDIILIPIDFSNKPDYFEYKIPDNDVKHYNLIY